MSHTSYKVNVTKDKLFHFFDLYDRLGKSQKKILQRLMWYYNKYPNAHPSQAKIAKGIPCTREHVNRTIALFKSYGWISLESRGARRTKTIKMQEWLALMDLTNRQWFKRIEITSEITYSSISSRRSTGRKAGGAIPPLLIPHYLQKLKISLDSKLKLSLVSEHTYHETLYACRKRAQKGFKARNDEKYFVGYAINRAIDKGEKLQWKSYYNMLGK